MSQFSWNSHCALRVCTNPNSQNQGHHADISELRRAIEAGQSIRLAKSGPIATTGKSGQLFCETGGSTGTPKVIARSQASWIASFDINRDLFGITSADCMATFGGLKHSLALYAVIEAAHLGADICMLAGLRPTAQCAELTHQNATLLYSTPTQLKLLTRTNAVCPNVRQIIIGGGAVLQRVRAAAKVSFPNAVLTQFYGASETSFITMANANTPDGSVGSAYPNVTVRFTDENGAHYPNEGEIWIKSPYLFDGYDQGDSADTQIKEGFVTVGELGHMDAAGHLYLHGRKSRMVTVADQNVFPEDIERFVADRFQVEHAVVLAQPDALRGHKLTVIVQGGTADMGSILRHCRDHFGPIKTPRRTLCIDQMPVLPSGKPDLITLATWLETQE